MKWRCRLCGRGNFDSPYQPHSCVGGFRKKLPPFEQVDDNSAIDKDTAAALVQAGAGAEAVDEWRERSGKNG